MRYTKTVTDAEIRQRLGVGPRKSTSKGAQKKSGWCRCVCIAGLALVVILQTVTLVSILVLLHHNAAKGSISEIFSMHPTDERLSATPAPKLAQLTKTRPACAVAQLTAYTSCLVDAGVDLNLDGGPPNTKAACACIIDCDDNMEVMAKARAACSGVGTFAPTATEREPEPRVSETQALIAARAELRLVTEYFMTKWHAAAAEVKRVVNTIRHSFPDEQPSAPYGLDKLHASCEPALAVASYNIWNINHWHARRDKVVALLDATKADIVGIQEIRHDPLENNTNQLSQIAASLTDSARMHWVYHKVQDEEPQAGTSEGLGILARHPILESQYYALHMTQKGVHRGMLYAQVNVSSVGKVNFFVTHFGLHDIDQCRNIVQVLRIMNGYDASIPQFVVGDFNAYSDFEWPMDFLSHEPLPKYFFEESVCHEIFKAGAAERRRGVFHDIWTSVFKPQENIFLKGNTIEEVVARNKLGHTFPTFRSANGALVEGDHVLESCRPDRVLGRWGKGLVPCDVALFGDEHFPKPPPPREDEDEDVPQQLDENHPNSWLYPSDHRGVLGVYKIDDRADVSFDKKMQLAQRWKYSVTKPPGEKIMMRKKISKLVNLRTNLIPYNGHAIEDIFDSNDQSWFWSNRNVVQGDYIELELKTPATCRRDGSFPKIKVFSGIPILPGKTAASGSSDSLQNTTGEATAFYEPAPLSTTAPKHTNLSNLSSVSASFDGLGVATVALPIGSKFHKVVIKVVKDQQSWLAVREVTLLCTIESDVRPPGYDKAPPDT